MFVGCDYGSNKIFGFELFWVVESDCDLSFDDEKYEVRRLSDSAHRLERLVSLDEDVFSDVEFLFESELRLLAAVESVGSQGSYDIDGVFFGPF